MDLSNLSVLCASSQTVSVRAMATIESNAHVIPLRMNWIHHPMNVMVSSSNRIVLDLIDLTGWCDTYCSC